MAVTWITEVPAEGSQKEGGEIGDNDLDQLFNTAENLPRWIIGVADAPSDEVSDPLLITLAQNVTDHFCPFALTKPIFTPRPLMPLYVIDSRRRIDKS